MDYQTYLEQVKKNFSDIKEIDINGCETTRVYEEFFKAKWLFTKLKIFSFVSYADTISSSEIENYSLACLTYSKKNKPGLPIGIQNGVVCNNILVSQSVDNSAIEFATSRPKKHFSVFEMPIIFDLSQNKLYYYNGQITWGKLYQNFIKSYIASKFLVG